MFIEKISFNTSLTPIEISEILKEKTKPLEFMRLSNRKGKMYEGYVVRNVFEITRIYDALTRHHLVTIKGNIKELEYGSEINIKFSPHFTGYIVFFIFVIAALLITAIFTIDSIKKMKFNNFLFIPIVVIVIYLFRWKGFLEERKRIKDEIKVLLQAHN